SSVLLFTVPVAFPTSILQAPAGVEAITFPSANQIGVRVHAREKSILVSSEVYYPGWQVTVDGVKQPLLRANGVLMATALGPGTHEVLFEIHSKTVTAGIWLSLFTVAVSIVIWVRPHSGPVLT